MTDSLWSVRMRAASGTRHLSGVERLVSEDQIDAVALEMMQRARSSEIAPEFVRITLERMSINDVEHIRCLPVTTILTPHPEAASQFAVQILQEAGIAAPIAQKAFTALSEGLGPKEGALRGASLWDCTTGHRLEPDQTRGVRATHFDYSPEGEADVREALAEHGLLHFRTREALALATKVLWSGVIAELCWSDNPDYTTGYVATQRTGYLRLSNFKPSGARGGRIFFVDSHTTNIIQCIDRLEKRCVLIDPPIRITPAMDAEEYMR